MADPADYLTRLQDAASGALQAQHEQYAEHIGCLMDTVKHNAQLQGQAYTSIRTKLQNLAREVSTAHRAAEQQLEDLQRYADQVVRKGQRQTKQQAEEFASSTEVLLPASPVPAPARAAAAAAAKPVAQGAVCCLCNMLLAAAKFCAASCREQHILRCKLLYGSSMQQHVACCMLPVPGTRPCATCVDT